MTGEFMRGLACLGAGFSIIRRRGIRPFVIIPILINITVFAGLAWFLSEQFSGFLNSISWLNPDPDSWYYSLVDGMLVVLKVIFGFALLIIFAYTFTLVANLIASPFNSLLAERIEADLKGTLDTRQHSSTMHVLKSIPHILRSETSKILYLLLWLIPVLVLYLIPGINIIAPVVSFIFGAWMFTLEYIDYPMGNHGYYFSGIRRTARKRRQLSLGFGSAVTLLTSIPVINLVAMPVAVAGATKMWVDDLSQQKEEKTS